MLLACSDAVIAISAELAGMAKRSFGVMATGGVHASSGVRTWSGGGLDGVTAVVVETRRTGFCPRSTLARLVAAWAEKACPARC